MIMDRRGLIRRLGALRFLVANDGKVGSQAAQQEAVEALDEAVQLLRIEAPRLLIVSDFNAEDADNGGAIPCWKEAKSPTRRSGWAVICYGKWLADQGVARYWTGKPSDKQREATPWT